MSPVATGGRCATHPERSAVEVCARCGAFTCDACLQLDQQEPPAATCAACHTRALGAKASGRAVTAIVLGVLSVSVCPPLGVAAWVLGQIELEAIERGEAPQRGRNLARGARIIGVLMVALTVLLVLVVLGLALMSSGGRRF